jgi:hypothetical protein
MFDAVTVRSLLARLRDRDPAFAVFGASSHQYALGALLPEPALAAWERQRGIELPSDYRTFLLELGNGGAGPFYGIFRLGMWGDTFHDSRDPWDDDAGDLRADFPYREAWNLPASRLEPPDDFDSDEDEQAWHDALDAEYFNPSRLDGAFWICHHGCALRTVLVVTGPERGNVWLDARPDLAGILPHTDERGRHMSFGDWYLDWLERSLSGQPV